MIPSTKRKSKPVSALTRTKRKDNANIQHQQRKFLNTHVKKETLKEFVELYDEFIQSLFASEEYSGSHFKTAWNLHYRTKAMDLDYADLDSIVEELLQVEVIPDSGERERLLELYDDLEI
jgi:hypothetical protein